MLFLVLISVIMDIAVTASERSKSMSEYIYEITKDADGVDCYIKRGEVVRCKNCKYRKKITNCTYGECIYSASMVADNDFCSNGEKKEDKTQEEWEI